MEYITVQSLAEHLKIAEIIGIIMIEKKKAWLRLMSSEIIENNVKDMLLIMVEVILH